MIPGHIRDRYPYYAAVPKDLRGNIAYRRSCLLRAQFDHEAQKELWIACSRDLLFYVNVFGYTYDPRRENAVIPMITYPFQDEGFYQMDLSVENQEDILIEKSRDMGVSWMMLFDLKHKWHFSSAAQCPKFLLLSRKEDLVDKIEDPDSLFWKLDFMLKNDPPWLRPSFDRKSLQLTNTSTGSTISGESTNSDAGRGGRNKVIVLDEFASVENGEEVEAATVGATRCRWFNSTPKGVGNAFYRKRNSKIRRVTFHWSLHPEKRQGLYRPSPRGPEIIDRDFWDNFRDGERYLDPSGSGASYSFSTEVPRGAFGLRSYWYDRECDRMASPIQVAQELDIDYQGSGYQFFDSTLIERHKQLYARTPDQVGRLEYDFETFEPLRFVPDNRSGLELWLTLTEKGTVDPSKDYCIGADISQGTGASNSSLSIVQKHPPEKVAQFSTPHMDPVEFAKNAVAIARWFNNALLVWEVNGPGTAFGNAVLDIGYRNIWYRRNEDHLNKKVSDVPGWVSGGSRGASTKQALLSDYRQAIQSGAFVNRSAVALEECLDYVFGDNDEVLNARSRNDSDPTGAKANHGDRVIADALAWKMVRRPIGEKRKTQQDLEASREPPPNSYAGRRRQHERELAAQWKY